MSGYVHVVHIRSEIPIDLFKSLSSNLLIWFSRKITISSEKIQIANQFKKDFIISIRPDSNELSLTRFKSIRFTPHFPGQGHS